MLCLPVLEKLYGEQKVFIGLTLSGGINNDSRAFKSTWRQGISRMVFMILARNPVNQRVKMRAGMLPALYVITVA